MSELLGEGDLMPEFNLPTDGGGETGTASLGGNAYVLYLYPKDDTSGCTKQAIAFTQALADFRRLDVAVLGLSRDNVTKHDKFKAKYDLDVTLASDEEGKLIEALGSWVEKSMYGRKYMGIDRSTFLVGRDGKIARIWRKVKVPGHVDEVLAAARSLLQNQAA